MYTKWSKLLVVANTIICGAASALQSPLLDYKGSYVDQTGDLNVGGTTSNNPHTAACTPNFLNAAWKKQLQSHIFNPFPSGEGMHATTAVLDAAQQGLAQNLEVQAGDWDTRLLNLTFEDQNGRAWTKTVWSDDSNYPPPPGGFPIYPEAERRVEAMCKYAMQRVNCRDGGSTVIVYTGFNDDGGEPINICVQIVLDVHSNFPGRSCYPKGVLRYRLPAGTVNPVQCPP